MLLGFGLFLHFYYLLIELVLFSLKFNIHSFSSNPRVMIKIEKVFFEFRVVCPSNDNGSSHSSFMIPVKVENEASANWRGVMNEAQV